MQTTPAKRGRKALDPADKQSVRVVVKLTPAEATIVSAAAGEEALGTWARAAIVRAAKRAGGVGRSERHAMR
ncbi:MAG: hypothetical protein ACRCT8_12165 [Lacipirellulaceae bacterium]